MRKRMISTLLVAGLLAPTLGTEFLPGMDEGSIVVQPFQIPSVSLEQSLQTVALIEATIMELPEVRHVVSRTGRSDISSDPMGVGESDVYAVLRPREEWTTATAKSGLVSAIRERMAEIPGVEFGYTQPIQMRVDELLSGVKSQIAVKIFGEDLGRLAELGDRASELLRRVEGAVDVKVEAVEGLGHPLTVELGPGLLQGIFTLFRRNFLSYLPKNRLADFLYIRKRDDILVNNRDTGINNFRLSNRNERD